MKELLGYLYNFRLLYLIFAGLFFYLVSITFNLIFVPMLDMPESWCKKQQEIEIGYRSQNECIEFSTKEDELKYHHNQKMEKRLTGKMYGLLIAAALLTFAIMLLSPGKLVDHRITFENYSGAVAVAVFYGIIIGILLPVVFEALLPPSEQWLPVELYEIKQARTDWVLKKIAATSTLD